MVGGRAWSPEDADRDAAGSGLGGLAEGRPGAGDPWPATQLGGFSRRNQGQTSRRSVARSISPIDHIWAGAITISDSATDRSWRNRSRQNDRPTPTSYLLPDATP